MASKKEDQSSDLGKAEVQQKIDVWNEQGFRGGAPIDPTPNHAYTLEGVTAGEPTPETDIDAEAAAKGPGPLAAAAAEAEAVAEASGD